MLFSALLRALRQRYRSCEALYYKGGHFFANGSLIHFEVARLEDPECGLLEWATPECLGPRQAALYAKAQERALAQAVAAAEAELPPGRLFLLKNNEDRYGNPYGCHESYDVGERPDPSLSRLVGGLLHPLALLLVLLLGLALAVPLIGLLGLLLLVTGMTSLVALVPGLGRLGQRLQERVQRGGEALLEGVVPHVALGFLRVGGRIFSATARWVLFTGHLPALLPFLVTRPVFAGAGHLGRDGRFLLTPRAGALRRTLAAFIFGPSRPMIDVKEFFYRRPLSWRARRKRLHVLAGDANRSEYAELLKLGTTVAVLDAVEGGALDELARRIELLGGPLHAFRQTAADPTLKAVVARDRQTGEELTALGVQRLYLEAVWEHHRGRGVVPDDVKDALVRWNFVLDALGQGPAGVLDAELDWVIKLELMNAVLRETLTDRPLDAAWAALQAWGPLNVLIEEADHDLSLPQGLPADEVARRVQQVLRRAWPRAARAVERAGLDWADLPALREAWLRLKTVDLKYHEISREGGYYDWWVEAHRAARVLEPAQVERACSSPPEQTRAAIRGGYVTRASEGPAKVRVGWEKVVVDDGQGSARTIHLRDPYQHRLDADAG